MDSRILNYADEILTCADLNMEFMTVSTVKSYLETEYGLTHEEIDAVIAILEGEGYFDV